MCTYMYIYIYKHSCVHLPPPTPAEIFIFLLTTGSLNYRELFFVSVAGGSPEKSFRMFFQYKLDIKHKPRVGEMILEKDRTYLMYAMLFRVAVVLVLVLVVLVVVKIVVVYNVFLVVTVVVVVVVVLLLLLLLG